MCKDSFDSLEMFDHISAREHHLIGSDFGALHVGNRDYALAHLLPTPQAIVVLSKPGDCAARYAEPLGELTVARIPQQPRVTGLAVHEKVINSFGRESCTISSGLTAWPSPTLDTFGFARVLVDPVDKLVVLLFDYAVVMLVRHCSLPLCAIRHRSPNRKRHKKRYELLRSHKQSILPPSRTRMFAHAATLEPLPQTKETGYSAAHFTGVLVPLLQASCSHPAQIPTANLSENGPFRPLAAIQ